MSENRPHSTARGYDRRWARTRGRYLQLHPVCSEPGCPEPATDVDHIDGLGPTGPNGHKHQNLRGYCHSHHSQRTARDQPGGWAAAPPRHRPAPRHPGLIDKETA